MRLFLLLCYLLITTLMICVILFQKSESSLGLGNGTAGGMMTARGTANLLTRLTTVLATLFIVFSLWLAHLAKREVDKGKIMTQAEGVSSAPKLVKKIPLQTPVKQEGLVPQKSPQPARSAGEKK